MRHSSKLYFAYGANTNMESMDYRCPRAHPLGVVSLLEHRLVFRGVGDVIPAKGFKVQGALWAITRECEEFLDAFEGYPNLYEKAHFTMQWQQRPARVMFYYMEASRAFREPSRDYEQCLREGYGHFGMPIKQIDIAIAHAQKHQAPPAVYSLGQQRKWTRFPTSPEEWQK